MRRHAWYRRPWTVRYLPPVLYGFTAEAIEREMRKLYAAPGVTQPATQSELREIVRHGLSHNVQAFWRKP